MEKWTQVEVLTIAQIAYQGDPAIQCRAHAITHLRWEKTPKVRGRYVSGNLFLLYARYVHTVHESVIPQT